MNKDLPDKWLSEWETRTPDHLLTEVFKACRSLAKRLAAELEAREKS